MFHRKVPAALPPELLPALAHVLDIIGDLTRGIDEMDKTIVALIRERYPGANFLQQVPGVGPLISLTYCPHHWGPIALPREPAGRAYLGLVPRSRDSAYLSPGLGISETGNTYLSQLLVNGSQLHPRLPRRRHGPPSPPIRSQRPSSTYPACAGPKNDRRVRMEAGYSSGNRARRPPRWP